MRSPDTDTAIGESGSSAGPFSTSPVAASNLEPWHGQSNSDPAAATTHCWCVQIALNATTCPAVGCAMSAGCPLIVASMLPPTGTSASAATSSPTAGASGAVVGSVPGSSVSVGDGDAVGDALPSEASAEQPASTSAPPNAPNDPSVNIVRLVRSVGSVIA
jgi:hypothetical protein